ncbi:MAG: MCE family protein [Bdellovibrionaceae bacterium]|nr:MCE family protein [Pseudobdellovibrionaceae bacterium]
MESSLKNQIKVGIFLVLGIAVTMTSIFMLGANKSLFSNFSHLYAEFENVQGLARGSVVSLSGVVIGNIEAIEFVPEKNLLRVDMKIEREYLNRVFKGSSVEIRTQGALGDKFIYIIPGNPRDGAIADKDILPIAKSTDLFNVIAERGKETERIFDIINEIYKLTKTINNENHLGTTLANMSKASHDFKLMSEKSLKIVSEFSEGKSPTLQMKNSIDKLNSILSKIDRGEGTLGALVNDSSLHDQLKSMVGGNQRKNHVKSLLRTSIEKE